jgi:signal transduction histidine kinase
MHYKLQLVFILLLPYSWLKSEIILDETFENLHLAQHIQYFEDKSDTLSLSSLQQMDFIPCQKPVINFRFSQSTYWLKLKLYHATSSPKTFKLDIGNHFLQHVDVYLLNPAGETTEHHSLGIHGQATKKQHTILDHCFINLAAHAHYTLLLRVTSTSPLRLPLALRTVDSFQNNRRMVSNLSSFFYGVAIFLLLFGLFVFFSLKDKIYLYFNLSLLFMIIYQIGYDNLYPPVELFGNPGFLLQKMNISILICMLFYFYFTETFFTHKSKPTHHILTFLRSILIVNIVLFLFSFRFGNIMAYSVSPFIWIILTFITYKTYLKGQKEARFIVTATLVLLIAICTHILSNLGFLPFPSLVPLFALKLGYLGLIIFFALALVDRYLTFQKNFTNILELKVEERTTALEDALTKMKMHQQQLIQSEKMASLGTLTAGVAHEINNPLNYINGGLNILEETLKDKTTTSQELKENTDLSLKMMHEGVDKASNIVMSLMTFAHRGKSTLHMTNIHTIIDNTLLFLSSQLPDDTNIIRNYRLEENIPLFQDKMHHILINIFENAFFALKAWKETPEKELIISTEKRDNKARISIENTGHHISDEHLSQLFDPFFTTKDPGQGTGLGLSITYSLVLEHGGAITAENTEAGVKFIIDLPLKEGVF